MSLVNAFYVMMISLMLCIVLNIGLGFALDRMLLAFAAAGLYDVSVEWEPTSGVGMRISCIRRCGGSGMMRMSRWRRKNANNYS